MTRLYRIILPVPNIEKAALFYAQVLGIAGERVSPGRHYFRFDDFVFALYDPRADCDSPVHHWQFHPDQFLYFATDNLTHTFKLVTAAGGKTESAIADMPWGETLFYARDPFGSPIAFVERGTVFLGAA